MFIKLNPLEMKMYDLLQKSFLVLADNNLDESLRLKIDDCLSNIEGVPIDDSDRIFYVREWIRHR